MSASLARVLYANGGEAGAKRFMHCGLISYQGEKMSKSLGNLVLVSQLRAAGVDPMAIRLTLLSHHYRSDWEWMDQELAQAEQRLTNWRTEFAAPGPNQTPSSEIASDLETAQRETLGLGLAQKTVDQMRQALATDLNAPQALAVVDSYLAEPKRSQVGNQLVANALDALLGLKL